MSHGPDGPDGTDDEVDDLDRVPATADGSLADVLSAVAAAPARPPIEPAIGTMIDETYRIGARLGAGGMGVVYHARDLHLQRDVAIKLHRAQHGLDRLQREAVAMAQLAHPNVLTVHAVGQWRGLLWVAMEYVPGATLRAWLTAAPRSWREILAVGLAAGSGLAAAHQLGFVHRDVKPDNILVGRDGRPRVGDFGLVRITGDTTTSAGIVRGVDSLDGTTPASATTITSPAPSRPAHARATPTPAPATRDDVGDHGDHGEANVDALAVTAHASRSGASGGGLATASPPLGSQLTLDGAAVGTPAYMAPEQFAGAEVDARADQFGFCVVMYEALYGRRPFAGETYAELERAVARGVPLAPPRGRAPARLWHVLRRGLQHDRAARYPDMNALLAALAAAPRHRRRLIAGAALLAVVAAGATAFAVRPAARMISTSTCAALGAGAGALWDGEARVVLGQRLAAIDRHLAADVEPRMTGALDRWTAGYAAAAGTACHKSFVERSWSASTADQAQRCLLDRLRPLGRITAALRTLERADVQSLAVDVLGLEDPGECLDERVLLGSYARPADPAQARQVARLEARLRRLDPKEGAERSDADRAAARAGLDALLPEIQAAAYPPLTARGLLVDGRLLREVRDFAPAADRFERAYATARAAGADALALAAARQVIWVHGVDLGRPTAARPWVVQALPEAERYGLQHSQARAVFHAAGVVAEIDADYARAVELHERILEVDTIAPMARAMHMCARAAALDAAGRSAEALPVYEEALAIFVAELGPEHPRVPWTLSNMIVARVGAGDLPGALADAERGVALLATAVGVDPYDAAMLHFNHAFALDRLDRPRESIPIYERLRVMLTEDAGPDSTDVADVEANLATAYVAVGRHADARPLLEHALAVRIEAYGEDHDLVASVVTSLADVVLKFGDCAAAVPHYQRAVRIFRQVEARTGVAMHRKAGPLITLGNCELEAARPARAIPLLEEAARDALADGSRGLQFEAALGLGLAYGATARLGDARAQLRLALTLIDDAEPRAAADRATIETWLRRHPAPERR